MKQKILLVLYLLSAFWSFGQDDLKPTLIPPHPDAAALGKYGDFQFTPYTGTPGIAIPIYKISYKDISVPITLNYDASGVKVAQQATWIGLGWTLQAGGVITRSVRSLNDRDAGQPYSNLDQADLMAIRSGNILTGNLLSIARDIANGNQDAEADLYFFNFNGRSGKFIETSDGFYVLDREDIKIEYASGWVITDEMGFRYTFSVTEQTYPNNYKNMSDFVSSWYLKKIESPTGYVISFYYKSGGQERTPTFTSRSYDVQYSSLNSPINTNNNRTSHSYSYVDRKILERIEYPGGSIVFNTIEGRQDNQASDSYGSYSTGHYLNSISVRAEDDSETRYFQFHQDYFHNGGTGFDNYRLRLSGLTEAPNEASVFSSDNKMYDFEYYNPEGLPSIQSESQDHWGYYTGRENQLLPQYDFVNDTPIISQRDASETAMTAGTLKKIKYPTGGITEFVYAPHEYSYVANQVVNEEFYTDEEFVLNVQKPEDPVTSRFKEDHTEFIGINSDTENIHIDIDFNYTSLPNSQQLRVQIIKPEFGNLQIGVPPTFHDIVDEVVVRQFFANSPHLSQDINLEPGTYYLKAVAEANNTSLHAECTITSYAGIKKKKKAGGLRVAKIINYDGITGKKWIRQFKYDDNVAGRSSGILVTPVKYDTYRVLTTGIKELNGRIASMTDGCTRELLSYWTEIRSSSYIAIGETSGSHIGYKQVIIEDIDEQGNNLGTTVETYTAPDVFVDSPKGFPSSSGTSRDLFRGKLLTRTIKDSGGNLIQELINTYDFDGLKSFIGIPLASNYQLMNSANSLHTCAFDMSAYSDIVGKCFLIKSVVKDYPTNNLPPIITTTLYSYDAKDVTPEELSHVQLTRQVEEKSNLETVATTYKYTVDDPLNSLAGNFFDRHIIAAPLKIEKKITETQQQLFNRTTEYSLFNGVPLVSSIRIDYGSPQSNLSISFDKYDTYGNITQLTDPSGITESFIWDSRFALPVSYAINSKAANIYTNNFENEEGDSDEGDSNSGLKSKIGGFLFELSGLDDGEYKLSYWLKQNSIWNLIVNEIIVSGGTYRINLTGQIDDLRFSPSSSQLKTYVYDPAGRLSTVFDQNNIRIDFEYDGLGRLLAQRDHNGDIIKTIEYKYKGILTPPPGAGPYLNYVISNTIKKFGVTDISIANNLGIDWNDKSITYFDDLGRPIQQVSRQATPGGFDLVQPFLYDEFGREQIKFLPFVSTNTNGAYNIDAVGNISNDYSNSAQYEFYQNTLDVSHDVEPYSQTIFETSPLNRVLKQGFTGQSWQPNSDTFDLNDHTVKMRYETNQIDEVIMFQYNETLGELDLSGGITYYPAYQLHSTRTFDEENHQVIEFKDKEGKVILKRVEAPNNEWADTYYIYDDFGNLVMVLPPEGVKQLLVSIN